MIEPESETPPFWFQSQYFQPLCLNPSHHDLVSTGRTSNLAGVSIFSLGKQGGFLVGLKIQYVKVLITRSFLPSSLCPTDAQRVFPTDSKLHISKG